MSKALFGNRYWLVASGFVIISFAVLILKSSEGTPEMPPSNNMGIEGKGAAEINNPSVLKSGQWVYFGPVVTIACGQKDIKPVKIAPTQLSVVNPDGSRKTWQTSEPIINPPEFHCQQNCGKGIKSYQLRSRLLLIEYPNDVMGKKVREVVDVSSSMVFSSPCIGESEK